MTWRKDEKWLDEQLQRAVNGTTPVFDAQAWKRRHSHEYQTLLSRKGQADQARSMPRIVRLALRHWAGRLVVAAALAVAIGLLWLGPGEDVPDEPTSPSQTVAQAPAEMMTMRSLRAAYRQGGVTALEDQLDGAVRMLGPRTNGIAMKDLFGS